MTAMPAEHTSNGTAPARPGEMNVNDLDEMGVRLPFGSLSNQTMPASWAASILTMLKEREPMLFGVLLTEASTGYHMDVTAAKRGRSKAGETA